MATELRIQITDEAPNVKLMDQERGESGAATLAPGDSLTYNVEMKLWGRFKVGSRHLKVHAGALPAGHRGTGVAVGKHAEGSVVITGKSEGFTTSSGSGSQGIPEDGSTYVTWSWPDGTSVTIHGGACDDSGR